MAMLNNQMVFHSYWFIDSFPSILHIFDRYQKIHVSASSMPLKHFPSFPTRTSGDICLALSHTFPDGCCSKCGLLRFEHPMISKLYPMIIMTIIWICEVWTSKIFSKSGYIHDSLIFNPDFPWVFPCFSQSNSLIAMVSPLESQWPRYHHAAKCGLISRLRLNLPCPSGDQTLGCRWQRRGWWNFYHVMILCDIQYEILYIYIYIQCTQNIYIYIYIYIYVSVYVYIYIIYIYIYIMIYRLNTYDII